MNEMWSRCGGISLPSGRLSISDSSFFHELALVADLEPGTYDILGMRGGPGADAIIQRIRAVRVGASGTRRGRLLGHVDLQFSQLALADRVAAECAYQSLSDEECDEFAALFSMDGLSKLISFKDGTPMLLVKPGEGDLDPAVFELCDHDGSVGVELVCIEPEARR